MNLKINYDFFNAICDINEDFTPFKVIRNNKKRWVLVNIPLLTSLEYLAVKDKILRYLPLAFCIHFAIIFSLEAIEYKLEGDKYKEKAKDNLRYIVPELETIKISTSMELLKEAKCYKKISIVS